MSHRESRLKEAQAFFENLFFNPEHYDLSPAGRLILNQRLRSLLNAETGSEAAILSRLDILAAVKELVRLKDTNGSADDIEHLGTRRVRAVGELLENQFRAGLVQLVQNVKTLMNPKRLKKRKSLLSRNDMDNMMPHDLINSKPVSAEVKKFFGNRQLSQVINQNNPLSEIIHKRRLSALVPVGLARDQAGFEVRSVHPTHYGRICPIETPEGPNSGLIVSLSAFARVNENGFIETPCRTVFNGKASAEIKYISAMEELDLPVSQAKVSLTRSGRFLNELVPGHVNGEAALISAGAVKLKDVSPGQMFSLAVSLVPFLEHDDGIRACRGSRMQRQAVPLLRTDSPLIGTGIESVVARDSGVTVVALHDGVVEDADASRIVMRYTSPEAGAEGERIKIYKLTTFPRSTQSTCINHRPIVRPGDLVRKGQVIA
ncbi:MAG: DNA-directed RNA polymerase subunit beta, partial [Deltaproteobacteria bacterium]|nr:DNA-directed RNA polymerase subunit beta [Deltaproteobacteria bacterium]